MNSFIFTQFSLQILELHPLLAKLNNFEPANGQKVLYVNSSYDLGDGSTALESPKGCFQYFLQPKGYLTSFAFETNGQYLNDQVRIVIFFSSGTDEVRAKREPNLFNESVNGQCW